jgi:hypothetical protein
MSLAAVLWALLAPGAGQAAEALAAFAGNWEAPPGAEPTALRIAVEEGGFSVTAPDPNGTEVTRRFRPIAPGAGVFELVPESGGLFARMIGSDERRSPLKGAPLSWARHAETGLIVYRLQLDPQGHFSLERDELSLQSGGLRLSAQRMRHASEPETVDTVLTRGAP